MDEKWTWADYVDGGPALDERLIKIAKLLKRMKAWEKENKGRDKPEGPLKKLFKGDKKKGGGRVSSRPKSYRTAKIMKQYAKGGSVRKPKRIK